jgi:hypothetical protein
MYDLLVWNLYLSDDFARQGGTLKVSLPVEWSSIGLTWLLRRTYLPEKAQIWGKT